MGAILFIAGVSAGIALMLLGDTLTIIISDRWMVFENQAMSIASLLLDYVMPTLSVVLLVKLLRRTKKG